MDAVIYTGDDAEFSQLQKIMLEERIAVSRDPLDGHGHYDYGYNVVVVALEGARGMQTVLNWSDRYPDAQIIWITSDPYFAGIALDRHICDFIQRPLETERFRSAVRRAISSSTGRRVWHFGVQK